MISTYKRFRKPGQADVYAKQFKYTLLDGSASLHISESMVTVSYVSLPESTDELGTGPGKKW
jgi:hypothetical protein